MAWPAVAMMVGGGIFKGVGAVKANEEQKGQNKKIGWIAENANAVGNPIGTQLEAGYAPGGWYRNLLTANQAAEAEQMRARGEPQRMARARGMGGIRSGAYADRRGGWADLLASARLAGDLGGAQAGTSFDMTNRYKRLNELASVPVAGNPYALAGNAMQSAGQTWWNQGSTYNGTGQGGMDVDPDYRSELEEAAQNYQYD